ncbi:MAG TPA: DUF4345 domain-containing protein [Burkholderiaceae bacterium]|nr:DUF4345 domain-containing protein [Burkholderiaceae bacterium]
MSRKLLQAATIALGLVPLITGVLTMLGLDDPIYAAAGLPRHPLLDSNLRFFGGVWLGLGVAMLWLVPSIERQTILYRALWGAVFVGGVGRCLSWALTGMPPAPFIGFTVLEIVGAPLFVCWQHRIAQAHAAVR